MDRTNLRRLLNDLLDHRLDESGRRELEQELQNSEEARREFWAFARLNTALTDWGMRNQKIAESSYFAPEGLSDSKRPFWARIRPARWAWASLAACSGLIIGYFVFAEKPENPVLRDSSIALLTSATDAEWTTDRRQVGDLLPPGPISLRKGLAEIQFYSGAVMVVEGPAEIELVSPKEVKLSMGRIRSHVPEAAAGFRVYTPKMEVNDLGTEFGVSVDRDQSVQLHVFEGKVATIQSGSTTSHEIKAGHAVKVDSSGRLVNIRSTPENFAGSDEMNEEKSKDSRRRLEDWRKAAAGISRDPATILHYTFDTGTPGNTIENLAPLGQPGSDGTIVACQWTQGRWAEKRALEFKRPSDRVRLQLEGLYESITLAAWLRIDGYERRFSGLFTSGALMDGEPLWQIRESGQLQFGRRPERGLERFNLSNSSACLNAGNIGRWVFAASIYDSATKRILHYLDGQLIGSDPVREAGPIRLGLMEIGNYNPESGSNREPVRNFRGRIDEFILIGRALTGKEIKELYTVGNPY